MIQLEKISQYYYNLFLNTIRNTIPLNDELITTYIIYCTYNKNLNFLRKTFSTYSERIKKINLNMKRIHSCLREALWRLQIFYFILNQFLHVD